MGALYKKTRQTITAALDQVPKQRRLLYIFTYAASLIAVQILHLAQEDLGFTTGLTGALTAGFVYSYYLAPRLRAWTTYTVSALSLGISIYYFVLISQKPAIYGTYLGVLLGIFMVLLAFKAFSPADHRFILMTCVIFLLFSSVASYDLKFMLLLPLFLVFSGLSLYIASQIDVAVRVASTTGTRLKVRFDVGGQFLWTLLRAVAGIIVFSVIVYVVTPHSFKVEQGLFLNAAPDVQQPLSSNLLDEYNEGGANLLGDQAEIGIGADFDLTDTRRLSENPKAVLRMRSHRKGYLRAQVFDVYTGSGWIKSPWMLSGAGDASFPHEMNSQSVPFPGDAQIISYKIPLVDYPSSEKEQVLKEHDIGLTDTNVYSVVGTQDIDYQIVRQEITLLETQPPYYFAMYQPFLLENVSRTIGGEAFDMPVLDAGAVPRPLDLDAPHPKEFTYTIYSLEPRVTSAQLKPVLSLGPGKITARYTQLPLEESPNIGDLARQGIEPGQYRPISQYFRNFAKQFQTPQTKDGKLIESPTLLSKVHAIREYLLDSDEFTYTRQFKPADGSAETTEAFCLGTQEGYCRQFASAMAVLCRLNGISSRVVTGYAPGNYSLLDNAYIYRASNAHAWVEVYFDGFGWVMFDPTPASMDPLQTDPATQWIAGVVNFLQELFVIDPAGTQKTILAALASLWRMAISNGFTTIMVILGMLLLLGAAWLLRRILRRSRTIRFQPENQVIASFFAIRAELSKLGFRQASGFTARRFLRIAADEHAGIARPLDSMIPVYERAAFAPRPVNEEDTFLAEDACREIQQYVATELKAKKRK
ncbi:transglutaminase domain-containing protein [bacterium]|nr:transglutaminase domain-containing protein [bacterium]